VRGSVVRGVPVGVSRRYRLQPDCSPFRGPAALSTRGRGHYRSYGVAVGTRTGIMAALKVGSKVWMLAECVSVVPAVQLRQIAKIIGYKEQK